MTTKQKKEKIIQIVNELSKRGWEIELDITRPIGGKITTNKGSKDLSHRMSIHELYHFCLGMLAGIEFTFGSLKNKT